MALHPEFPTSPYEPLLPEHRWFPADESLRDTAYDKLLPPLVANIRQEVFKWRNDGYAGASSTTKALLNWWFHTDHLLENGDGSLSPFRYYFAQREAVETLIWVYEVRKARDKFDLLRFDASEAVSSGMFAEDWPRYILKMATGSGKTKVISLLIAWSFFHKLYEPDSALARNFLLIAPNIIVLDRLRTDFDGLRIFFNDPVIPENGFQGQNWRDDFQITLHIQDDVRVVRETGNLFLTNIHRVYLGETVEPSLEDENLSDYFLAPFGRKPSGKTTDSQTDLGEIIREVEELAVFNDEAHHIHNPKMAWFKSIQDIHHKMLQKDKRLALQVDVTATPRHDNGSIFVQTISDYPLVEAIHQNIVKHPVLPDAASRAKLHDHTSAIFTEKYSDYLALGIEEWRVSVLMLKEGWDVRNVTTIVGLRAYAAASNILPEQTLGRGLRRMYFGKDIPETVSVMGTPAFMEFVESIQTEGVSFEHVPMGMGAERKESLIVEVETDNADKDIEALDIRLPKLTRRYYREFMDLGELNPAALGNAKLGLKQFTPEETREIVFKTMLDSEIHHTVSLDGSGPADYRSVVAFFARQLLKDLRLVGGYEILYPKVRDFIRDNLFQSTVDLEDPVVLRNLSEPDVGKILYDSFKKAINSLTIHDTGSFEDGCTVEVEGWIRLSDTRPFRTEHRAYLPAKKSVFSKIVGEPHSGGFELTFAAFLDSAPDVTAFAKNYLAVGFKLDYVKSDGDLSTYTPDFIVRSKDGAIWIIETKGRKELDLPRKMDRLKTWCNDATHAKGNSQRYNFIFIDQEEFEKHTPKNFDMAVSSFVEFKE
jgi:hypothetical protein